MKNHAIATATYGGRTVHFPIEVGETKEEDELGYKTAAASSSTWITDKDLAALESLDKAQKIWRELKRPPTQHKLKSKHTRKRNFRKRR